MARTRGRANIIGRLLEKAGRLLRGAGTRRSRRTPTRTRTRPTTTGGLLSKLRRLLTRR